MTDLRTDDADTIAWQDERDAAATTLLRGLSCYPAMRERVAQHLVDVRRAPVVRRGNHWFQSVVVSPDDEHPVVVVRSSPSGQPRVLVDPNALSAERGVAVSLQWFVPSPDGSVLAYAVAAAGTEMAEVGLIDVHTGSALPDEVPWNVTFPVSWLPDGSGFWCSGREVIDGQFRMPVYRFVLGEPAADAAPVPDGPFPRPEVSADGRYVALVTGNTEVRIDYIVVDGEVRPLLLGVPGSALGRFVGDELIAIVDGDAPRGRLVRIPVATVADTSTWTELVPQTADVLRWVEVVGDAIVLGYLRDATAWVRVLDVQGRLLDEVALPGGGVVASVAAGTAHPKQPMFSVGDDEISFVFSTFTQSQSVYRYVVSERRLELIDPPAVVLDGITVTTVTAVSSDGVEVPAHVVHRADLDLSRPQPTLLHGYGGFNLAWLPSYSSACATWVEAGGVFVLPHLRGGSEFGRQWWQQGSRENKQRTFDDLYAVARRLIELGWSTPAQLAVKGESNGGLLAGAALVQRPELWAAVIADIPILDLLEMTRDPLTYAIGRAEYGDPLDPNEAEWLRSISPVEHVAPAVYPTTLVSAGTNDPRCPAWHARVLIDLLEQAQRGDAPILLRVHREQGHGAAGLSATVEAVAQTIALAATATGLT